MWGITNSIVDGFRKAPAALWEGIKDMQKLPGLNLPPIVLKIIADAPEYWDRLPDEQKQVLFNALVSAGTVALENYAYTHKTVR